MVRPPYRLDPWARAAAPQRRGGCTRFGTAAVAAARTDLAGAPSDYTASVIPAPFAASGYWSAARSGDGEFSLEQGAAWALRSEGEHEAPARQGWIDRGSGCCRVLPLGRHGSEDSHSYPGESVIYIGYR